MNTRKLSHWFFMFYVLCSIPIDHPYYTLTHAHSYSLTPTNHNWIRHVNLGVCEYEHVIYLYKHDFFTLLYATGRFLFGETRILLLFTPRLNRKQIPNIFFSTDAVVYCVPFLISSVDFQRSWPFRYRVSLYRSTVLLISRVKKRRSRRRIPRVIAAAMRQYRYTGWFIFQRESLSNT